MIANTSIIPYVKRLPEVNPDFRGLPLAEAVTRYATDSPSVDISKVLEIETHKTETLLKELINCDLYKKDTKFKSEIDGYEQDLKEVITWMHRQLRKRGREITSQAGLTEKDAKVLAPSSSDSEMEKKAVSAFHRLTSKLKDKLIQQVEKRAEEKLEEQRRIADERISIRGLRLLGDWDDFILHTLISQNMNSI